MGITVANLKGEPGKTTTCVYLATLAARKGRAVLIDGDPQASSTEWLEEQPIDGVTLVQVIRQVLEKVRSDDRDRLRGARLRDVS